MRKKMSTVLAALLVFVLALSACGNKTEEPAATEPEVTEEPAEEVVEEVKEDAILVVSFGTSYNDTRDITIGAVEEAITAAYPDYDVRRAFTAQIVIDILEEREGMEIDNVTEALDRAVADGIKNLIVQPTHLMDGLEYADVLAELEAYEADFESITVARPLLTSNEDYAAVISAITGATAAYDDGETAIVYMGHGTHALSNAVYQTMQDKLTAAGYENYYVGTVEGEGPTFDDVAAALEAKGAYKKVVLAPLMVVAGDHANNDMAGDEEGAWKVELEAKGYEVECILEGLGQYEEVQNLYVEHIASAIEKQNQSADTAILAVSFGTSFDGNRDITISAVENAIADAFPEYPVRRAFTAQIVIDIMEEAGLETDNITEALDRAVADGVKNLVVQPTHLMAGLEYDDVMAVLAEYESDFDKIVVGDPLLTSDADYEAVIAAITEATAAYNTDGTAVVFMGHGTHHASNAVYQTMQDKLAAAGYDNYYVGTVEGEGPTFDDVAAALKEGGYEKVVLAPLMVVAGDHANNDMAGNEEGAWKVELEAAGYEVTCLLNGLGEYAGIRDLYVAHTQAAVDGLAE